VTARNDDVGFLDGEHPPLRRLRDASREGSRQRELAEQFESVLEFVDFCMYLTDGRVSDRVEALVSMAEALYAETAEDLRPAPREN
jgi:hypothetical protein